MIVDLKATKMPSDSSPMSEWVLSSNKGIILSDDRQELRIHDERISGSSYQLDISITNIGNEKTAYNMFYAYVKDENGLVYQVDLFSTPEPRFSSGELQPGEKVRGWLAFNVGSSAKKFMFIYDVVFGSYFATGNYIGSEKQVAPPEPRPKPTIINPISVAKVALIDQLGNVLAFGDVDIPLGIEAEIKNTSPDKVVMSYIIQVKDSEGITVFLTWIRDLPLPPNESAKPAIFWTPTTSGSYTVEVFVWKSISEPIPLSSPVTTPIKIR